MLSQDEDVEAHALRRRGWSVAAIARHLNRRPRTIKAYLSGERVVGYRRQPVDAFVPFLEYCRLRLTDDPHLWSSVLFDELGALGYLGGYSTFTRALRRHGMRPHCEPCQGSDGRDVAIIEHPAGEEIQFDWLELPRPPEHWGLGKHPHLLVGALSYSGRWRGVLADAEDFPHLIEALDGALRRLGGVSQVWRFDRMGTVFDHRVGEVSAAFAAVAKYSCLRCPMLNINPKMLPRLDEIEEDLLIRLRRAEHKGWLGEVEGIDLTLAFLRQKREETQQLTRIAPIDLGIPGIPSKESR